MPKECLFRTQRGSYVRDTMLSLIERLFKPAQLEIISAGSVLYKEGGEEEKKKKEKKKGGWEERWMGYESQEKGLDAPQINK